MLIPGKRELVARVCAASGLTRLLEYSPKRRVLMVLNYHRIGNASETPYDSGTFSATEDEFDWQISYVKRHFHVATLEEAIALLDAPTGRVSEPTVLVTLDDGYLDSYTTAFPVLRSHAVQAVFFLTTAFVGTNHLPWWDVIAYIVKRSRARVIRLEYPEPMTFDLDSTGMDKVIMQVLQLYKQPSMKDYERFVAELERACDSARPPANVDRRFLNWDEAREMERGGMAIGSHTHTHQILGKLSREQQTEELQRSRRIMEQELGHPIKVVAYPSGGRDTFSADTTRALADTGYKAAFSFYGGFNEPGKIDRFDIHRCGIGGQSRPRLRLQAALGAMSGTYWF